MASSSPFSNFGPGMIINGFDNYNGGMPWHQPHHHHPPPQPAMYHSHYDDHHNNEFVVQRISVAMMETFEKETAGLFLLRQLQRHQQEYGATGNGSSTVMEEVMLLQKCLANLQEMLVMKALNLRNSSTMPPVMFPPMSHQQPPPQPAPQQQHQQQQEIVHIPTSLTPAETAIPDTSPIPVSASLASLSSLPPPGFSPPSPTPPPPSVLEQLIDVLDEQHKLRNSPEEPKHDEAQGDARKALQCLVSYCGRRDWNNLLCLTCTALHRTTKDREFTLLPPWPMKCPIGRSAPNDILRRPHYFVFSRDGSRVAVFIQGSNGPSKLEVWDRARGYLGEIQNCGGEGSWIKPVFSPDATMLVCPPSSSTSKREVGGIRVCHLPSMTLTHHRLGETADSVWSIDFVDDETIAFMSRSYSGIQTCKFIRECRVNDDAKVNGHDINQENEYKISISEPMRDPALAFGRRVRNGRLATFYHKDQGSDSSKDKFTRNTIMAFVTDRHDRCVVLHDFKRHTTTTKPIADKTSMVRDLAFSPDGSVLVVAHNKGGISVYDCNFNKSNNVIENDDSIEKVSQPRVLPLEGLYGEVAFSLDSRKIVVKYQSGSATGSTAAGAGGSNNNSSDTATTASPRVRMVHLENGNIISDGWLDSSWKLLVSAYSSRRGKRGRKGRY